MLKSAATFERPARDFLPLFRTFKFRELKRLQPGSVLDKTIRLSNAVSDLSKAVSWMRFLAELEHRHRLERYLTGFRLFDRQPCEHRCLLC